MKFNKIQQLESLQEPVGLAVAMEPDNLITQRDLNFQVKF